MDLVTKQQIWHHMQVVIYRWDCLLIKDAEHISKKKKKKKNTQIEKMFT